MCDIGVGTNHEEETTYERRLRLDKEWAERERNRLVEENRTLRRQLEEAREEANARQRDE